VTACIFVGPWPVLALDELKEWGKGRVPGDGLRLEPPQFLLSKYLARFLTGLRQREGRIAANARRRPEPNRTINDFAPCRCYAQTEVSY